jgi:hypothetical protein
VSPGANEQQIRILVIAAREDLAILRETRRLLTSTGEPQ